MQKKVLIFHNMVNPTRTGLFNAMYDYFQQKGYTLKVIFNSPTESNRNWDYTEEVKKFKFEYVVLNSTQMTTTSNADRHYFHLNLGIWKLLNSENPDKIIHYGWASLTAFVACFWSKRKKREFTLQSESTVNERSWRRTITKPLVKWIVRSADWCWPCGNMARDYLLSLGVKSSKIQILMSTIDVDYFMEKADALLLEKAEIRKSKGIPNGPLVLFVGQLIKRKGVYELLHGFANWQIKQMPEASLVFIGSGPEEGELKKMAMDLNASNIIFTGYCNFDEICTYYAAADIFTLPSHEETWGLVVNEARCFGLPVLTVKTVGSSSDLVRQGMNGVIMEKTTVENIEKALTDVNAIPRQNMQGFREDMRKMNLKSTAAQLENWVNSN